jgi:flagellar protein FlbD
VLKKGKGVILVSRLNGSQFYINAELIQSVESTPDTVITLTNNVVVIVKNPAEQVVNRIIAYQRQVRGSRQMDEEMMKGSGA